MKANELLKRVESKRAPSRPNPSASLFVRSLCPVDLESVLLDQGPIAGSPAVSYRQTSRASGFRFADGRRPGEPDAMKSLLESLEAIRCAHS
jgi:hypothetical protein